MRLVRNMLFARLMASAVPICARAMGPLALTLALSLGLSGAAQAEDVLAIPGECGSSQELTRAAAALQRGPASGVRPAVRMGKDGAEYTLEVDLPAGTRRLRDRDCRSLFRAAVLIAALGEEAEREEARQGAATQPQRDEPVEPASSAAQLSSPRQATAPARARPRNRSRPELRPPRLPPVRELAPFVAAGLGFGLVPSLDATLSAGLSGRFAWLAGRASLGYLTPRSQHEQAAGVRVDGVSASATLEVPLLRWLRPGLGVDYHLLRGRGLGISRSRTDWAALATLHASLVLRVVRLGPVQLDLLLRGLVAPRTSHFRVRGAGDVYGTSALGGQAGLSLAWHLR